MSEIYWAPFDKPPLNMNQRLHHFTRAKLTKEVREFGKQCGLDFSVKHGIQAHLIVKMVWIVPDRRRRDAENPVSTLKAFCDGLVDSGVIPDDVPQFQTKQMPFIVYQKGDRRVYFVLEAQSEQPAYARIAA